MKLIVKNIFLILSVIAAAGSVTFLFIDMTRAKEAMGAAMILFAFHIFFYIMVGTTGVDKTND